MPSDFETKIFDKNSFPVLAGPCVIESEDLVFEVASKMKSIMEALAKSNSDFVYVFKASSDKANRTSIHSFRGPGLEKGLEILAKVKKEFNLPVVSDIHEPWQAKEVAEVLDIIQIPAFLCRQTDLIEAAARTGKVLNIKKGQFLSPAEVKNIIAKCKEAGNEKVFITERGSSFGYNNLVVDMRSFEQMKNLGVRTIFDATHSCQMPGAGGDKTLGQREFAPILARAAVAAGATGLFAETHPNPDRALSDGPNMIPLAEMQECLEEICAIRSVLVRSRATSIAE